MSDFAAKMHDIDGATVSFASIEIDETKRIRATPRIDPGLLAWQA